MSDRLEDLAPDVRDKAEAFIAALDGMGIRYHVHETLRSEAVQWAYYAQGRRPFEEVNGLRAIAKLGPIMPKQNEETITKCDGRRLKSKHQSGRALDVYPVKAGRIVWSVTAPTAALWLAIGEVGEACGFEWGGRWPPLLHGIGWDAPHFEAR